MLRVLNKYLQKDEKIIMTFSPDVSVKFASADIFLMPLSFMCFIWAFIQLVNLQAEVAIVQSNVVGRILFLLFSLYFMFGRFFVKNRRKKNTVYCISNKRFYRITKNLFGGLRVDFVDIKDSDELEIDGTPPAASNIVFKKIPFCFTKFLANTGLAFETPFYAFVDVRRGIQITNTVGELKQQAEIAELIETREKIEAIKKAQERANRSEIETLKDDSENNNNKPEI